MSGKPTVRTTARMIGRAGTLPSPRSIVVPLLAGVGIEVETEVSRVVLTTTDVEKMIDKGIDRVSVMLGTVVAGDDCSRLEILFVNNRMKMQIMVDHSELTLVFDLAHVRKMRKAIEREMTYYLYS